MRGDKQVGAFPEWVLRGQRFGIGDVEGGANASRVESTDQRIGLNDRAARGIDQQRALRHEGKLLGADEAVGFRSVGQDQDHDFGVGQKLIKSAYGMDFRRSARAAGNACDFDVEGSQIFFDGFADVAVAYDQDSLSA